MQLTTYVRTFIIRSILRIACGYIYIRLYNLCVGGVRRYSVNCGYAFAAEQWKLHVSSRVFGASLDVEYIITSRVFVLSGGEEVILWSSVFASKQLPFPRPDVFRSALKIRTLSCGENLAAFVTSECVCLPIMHACMHARVHERICVTRACRRLPPIHYGMGKLPQPR
jgi:hypothetical protein